MSGAAPLPAGRVVFVGGVGGTNVAAAFHRAALDVGLESVLVDHAAAGRGPRLARSVLWRAAHRPLHLRAFSRAVIEATEGAATLVTTGCSPVDASALAEVGAHGIRRVNISTDDPWSATLKSRWFLEALPHYDTVFTPRMHTCPDFDRAGVRDVRRLPFAYDPAHCLGPEPDPVAAARLASDVLFVGGADAERVPYIRALARSGVDVAVYGAYWSGAGLPAGVDRGHVDPEVLRQATLSARAALVLVRRSNRDSHTMRSVEAGAIGACVIAEDTPDHRALYGDDGALYFSTPPELVTAATSLLADPSRRHDMADRSRRRSRSLGLTYASQLRTVLAP